MMLYNFYFSFMEFNLLLVCIYISMFVLINISKIPKKFKFM